eukprot:234065-Prymnesium_polylepis.2
MPDTALPSSAALALEAEALRRRRELGRRSCIEKKIGPQGGYCLSPHRTKVGGNFYLPRKRLAPLLGVLFANQSVLESVWPHRSLHARPGARLAPVL